MKIKIVLITCILCSSLCFAQGSEESDFILAKRAFTDGFFGLAQEDLESFALKYPDSAHFYEAHLLS